MMGTATRTRTRTRHEHDLSDMPSTSQVGYARSTSHSLLWRAMIYEYVLATARNMAIWPSDSERIYHRGQPLNRMKELQEKSTTRRDVVRREEAALSSQLGSGPVLPGPAKHRLPISFPKCG
ncbi:hypothetical protein J6590_027915 [Homalodisca vitripennis]|nr:hypothetical protein J6590_027915 [Homalodisca vitripennis]